ncbi:MAG: hypothetical protein CFK52_03900 [Chloracidobacterium sp. CP2_5A]|nr:MAG: hypothetical protein CFK52_03900 [Chloracidobacterium sp. CP2_5A]
MALSWKHCIRCGLRHEPAAFARLAALEGERRAILAQLLPAATPGAPPIRASSPADALVKPPPSLLVNSSAAPPASGGAVTPWLLVALIYGGSLLMVVGAAIYFREAILERPALQLAMLAGVTAGVLGLGVRGAHRRPEDLAAQGGLWIGALLLPLNFWAGVYHGRLPAGGGWAYALACGATYWLLAAWVANRILAYLPAPALLLAVWWLGLDVATPGVAATLASAAAAGLAAWSARHPGQVLATPGRRWAGFVIAGCAVASPLLSEAWAGGVIGAACLVMGRLGGAPAAVWALSVGGLAAMTISYGRWLAALALAPSFQALGWVGWLWMATAGQRAASRWEATRKLSPLLPSPLPLSRLFEGLAQVVAGALGLWALAAMMQSACFPLESARMPLIEAVARWLALGLLLGWSAWHLREQLTWFPLALATTTLLAAVGALARLSPAQPFLILALPTALCATRLGVETLGVRFGQGYSTEVDTNFGLDFGLPNHPAIIPSRVILDGGLLGCLLGLLAPDARDWSVAQLLGFGVAAAYCGLCWLVNGVPRAQRAYALAMWSVAYLGLLNAGCGIIKRADLFVVLPWIALLAALALVGASRPVADEPTLRRSLCQVSLGALACGALVALVGMIVGEGRAGGHALTLTAAAVAGWTVAWRWQMPLMALLSTLCGGGAAIQAARLVSCPFEALPMIGVLYGYSATWLGWRRRRQAERASEWSALATGGQCFLWLAAVSGLMITQASDGLAVGGSLLGAAVALAVVSLIAADGPLHDAYALGGLLWGGAAYAWWLRYLSLPAFGLIAFIALPYGLAMGIVGWLKRRLQRGSPALSEGLIWAGSLIFCFPVALQALQRRLAGGVALPYDLIADTAALASLSLGLVARLRGPLALGGLCLSFHLSVVVAFSVPWGDIPYSVYLAITGLALFMAGTYLWRQHRWRSTRKASGGSP